jgi:hypothetical protein
MAGPTYLSALARQQQQQQYATSAPRTSSVSAGVGYVGAPRNPSPGIGDNGMPLSSFLQQQQPEAAYFNRSQIAGFSPTMRDEADSVGSPWSAGPGGSPFGNQAGGHARTSLSRQGQMQGFAEQSGGELTLEDQFQ